MTLPGLGRTRAAAVVLHRVRHGPFRTVDDLAQVDGLGPVTVERLRRHLRDPGK
jgi:competence protein ComEA